MVRVMSMFIGFSLLISCSSIKSASTTLSEEEKLKTQVSLLSTEVSSNTNQSATSIEQEQMESLATISPTLATRIPTPTPILDTFPGTLLEVGQSWYQNGLELSLDEAKVDLNWGNDSPETGIYLTFYITNLKTFDVALKYNLSKAISALDNRDRDLKVDVAGKSQYYYEPEDMTTMLRNGETILLASDSYAPPSIFIFADTTDLSLTEIMVTVSLSNISNARWQIPIYH